MEVGGATVADLVEAAAARSPDAVAVEAGGEGLTYAQLDAASNRLAHHLQSLGVGPDMPVGVCLPRSLELAVGLLGLVKAGGACVPLDPSYPGDRLGFMARDAGVAAVLSHTDLLGRLPAYAAQVVRLDANAGDWADRPPTPPARPTGPEHVAYVVYTSGSTGQPKGVMLTHAGLVNHHRAVVDLYGLGPGDRVLQFCSLGFDASIEELFPTWAAGATVVFRPDDIPLLGRGWLRWLYDERITVLNLPTAYWHAWARDLDAVGEAVPDDVRLVVVGGEKARGPAYRMWERAAGGRSRWINAYGPTETTCMSTFYEPPPGGGDLGDRLDPPIGRPLANTTVLVVDDRLSPVPAGVTGELLIGGAGLARGYLNRPELTAERFVGDPTGQTRGRMYRTGDLVRRLPGGDLDYVGRIDDQVKIRGFRVECGEVEGALARHPAVAEAAVVARDDPPGEKQLVAYVVVRRGAAVGGSELRRFLAGRLPEHMVPGAFTVVDALPLTPDGKVDRAALPAPVRPSPARHGRSGPRSPAEDRVAAIWARVLDLDVAELGPTDDFFDLGGHSLLATQVMAQVREEFGTETPLRAIFEAPTLAGLAAAAGSEIVASTGAPPLVARRGEPGTRVPLTYAQEQMWALETAASPPGLYNITALHRFDRPVDERALRDALAHVAERHEILRTGFAADDGRPYQLVVAGVGVELAAVDVTGGDAELQRLVAEQDATPFDLARPPLFRAGLLRLDQAQSCLAVTVDHLICDGTGAALLMTELLAACEGKALPPPDVQFADFAVWQRAHVTEEVLARQLEWWAATLAGMPLGPAVPFDHLPAAPTRRIASTPVAVGAATRARLEDAARATGSTVFTVATAAVAALLGRCGRTTDAVMSTTLSGRNRAEVEHLVGMFSGIGRIRVDLSGDPPFLALVARARERVLGMFENQDIPFLRVRRAVLPEFPAGGPAVAAALPVEFQYFHVGPEPDVELFFRGQLHPLSVTLLDDGTEITGEFSYKLDFYDPATVERLAADFERLLDAVAADPSVRLSELPVTPAERR